MKYLGKGSVNPLVKSALSSRERIQNLYRHALPPRLASLLSGIVLGLKGDIPDNVLETFGDGGVLHVTATPTFGLHV